MVNYGNSKALVAVVESQSGPGSASALSLVNQTIRPKNPAKSIDRFKQAWGAAGTLIEGEPLAIEYNQAVLEDRPPFEEIQEFDRRTGTEKLGKVSAVINSEKNNPPSFPKMVFQGDNTFITGGLNQQDEDPAEMVAKQLDSEDGQAMSGAGAITSQAVSDSIHGK